MKKKLLATLTAAVMVVSLAACGSSASQQASSAPQESSSAAEETAGDGEEAQEADGVPEASEGLTDMRVAMITDYGDITDQSFNQTTYEASKAFCEENGIEFTYYKPAGDSTAERVAMIDKAVAEGYNVVVLPGFAFADAIYETASLYPDVKYVALDVSEGDLTAYGEREFDADNVFSAVYQEEISGYFAGYALVKLGYTKLGFLGGMAVPAVQRFGYGFVQGADDAAGELGLDDVEVNYVYGGLFYGTPEFTAAMDTWFANGTEVVFACGGGIYTSAAEAAAKVDGKVVGVDSDQAPIIDKDYGTGMTVTSAMKGLAPTVNTLLSAIRDGNWNQYAGQVQNLGLVSATDPELNYVQLPLESTQWGDGFTKEDYIELVGKIQGGQISVSSDVSADPTADNITVNFQGNIQ